MTFANYTNHIMKKSQTYYANEAAAETAAMWQQQQQQQKKRDAAVRQQQWGSSNEAAAMRRPPHLVSKKKKHCLCSMFFCVSLFAFSVLGSPIGLCVFLWGVLPHPTPVKGKSLVMWWSLQRARACKSTAWVKENWKQKARRSRASCAMSTNTVDPKISSVFFLTNS